MASEPIHFFNRYTRQIEGEQVYGDGFLKWTYGTPLGKLALQLLVKRALFSKWYGWRMDRIKSREKIQPFIKNYHIDTREFAETPNHFKTFNEFFYRKLQPSARLIFPGESIAVFPADGRHLGFQDVSKANGIFVKGQVFNLDKLIQDDTLAKKYQTGSMVISRLCPVDYHRFHFPVNGRVEQVRVIPGPLYSVNPIALKQNIHIFTENKRACCEIDSPQFGTVLMFEIGATCVGSFAYTYKPGKISKGDEKGFFKFGGSSTILLFEPGKIQLDPDLLENSANQRELYARMGDRMGRSKSAQY